MPQIIRGTKRHSSIRPSHPGDVIADSLFETGITKAALARALGVGRKKLAALIDRRQGVTAEMALRLEAVLGSNAETWLAVQTEHDL